ncbi:unnamed protein product [Staurois parvus]|uniref:Uncharacterized protein n=1 Tax=Staurois parvus TaxID=386267 RepID=A0ABN9BVD6_9NEOB|nr:unnamed protein product [Staurois parvus]
MMGCYFLPRTTMVGHYSSHLHQHWGTIPPTDNNNGALFLPLTTTVGHYSSHTDTNYGALFLPLTPMMRNNAPPLLSVGGIVPHHWCQWEE